MFHLTGILFVLFLLEAAAFAPLQNRARSSSSSVAASSTSTNVDTEISDCLNVLNKAAESRAEDPELVFDALTKLEKLQRTKAKTDPSVATNMLSALNGSWRLVFTTGTADTQSKIKGKVNYFPLKAIQSFDTSEDPMKISNGIYIGNFNVLQFFGDFDFDLKKRKLEFDFDTIQILGLKIPLQQGQAAQLGAKSGLGSEGNVELAKRNRQAFFNWISADDTIATARGGGGGLALWKRVDDE
jgi:hypothetical protein